MRGELLIVWITGPQGSGKTTLAANVCQRLRGLDPVSVVHVDGDAIRDGMPVKLGYMPEHRQIMSSVYIAIARSLSDQGKIVVVSTVSNHSWVVPELRRTSMADLLIVRLKVPEKLRRIARPHLYAGETFANVRLHNSSEGNEADLKLSAKVDSEREAWTEIVVEAILQKLVKR